jgi:ADP-ribose pyrophosphatase
LSGLSKEIKIHSRTIYRGRILDLKVDQVKLPLNGRGLREVVVHKPAVAVVAVLDRQTLLLVRQYRYAVDQFMWEMPAGIIDPGETPRQAAARELAEETGYSAGGLKSLGYFYSSPGFTTEKIHVFLATALQKKSGHQHAQDLDENVVCRAVPLSRIRRMIHCREIRDAKTVLALKLAFPEN